MEINFENTPIPQYTLRKILMVWAAAAIPMGILGWVVAPMLTKDSGIPGIERLAVLTVGLVWQFVLVLFLLYQETGSFQWTTLKERLWLSPPHSINSGERRGRLWWWLVPLVLLTAFFEIFLSGTVNKLWVSLFPFLAEPVGSSFGAALNTPELRAKLVGAWKVYALFVAEAVFNTVLGEELLFRGLLLPRMAGVFGKWDWLMNGILFGLYHLHQPWGMLTSAIEGTFMLALPSRYFRSAWFGIIVHSGQSIFFAVLLLGLVLGLAK